MVVTYMKKHSKVKRPKCSIGIMVNKPLGAGRVLPPIPYLKVGTSSLTGSYANDYVVGIGKRKIFTRWWLSTRPCKNAVQLNVGEGIPACVEFYVPIWAWPLELLHRVVFGTVKLECKQEV